MLTQDIFDNDAKNGVRTEVLTIGKEGKDFKRLADGTIRYSRPVRGAFLLPGEKCRCLDEGRQSGLFSPEKTFVFCVESDPRFVPIIRAYLKRHHFRHSYVFPGDIASLSRETVREFFGKVPLEFAFFDFCDQLTAGIARWLANNCQGIFTTNTQFAFTFSLGRYGGVLARSGVSHYLQNVLNSALAFALPIKIANEQSETKFATTYAEDRLSTVAGLWAALGVNYTPVFTHFRGYTGSKTPMVMIKGRFEKATPFFKQSEKSYFWQLLYPFLSHRVAKNAPDWEKLGCHKLMTAGVKAGWVRRAKDGHQPDWLSDEMWAVHSLNPYRNKKAA